MTAGQAFPLVGELLADLLDRNVVRQVAVVLGEAVVDLEFEAERVGHRLGGLLGAPLRAAEHPGDRVPVERFRQPHRLLEAHVGQLGIGAFTGFTS